MIAFIKEIIPFLTVLAQLLFVAMIIVHKQADVNAWLKQHYMKIIFGTSLAAMLGSLFYSKIAAYTPCELCWYQRILMYPIVFISGFSLSKASKEIKRIILSLSIIGALFAVYHYVTQITDTTTFCGIGATDCSTKIVFAFGYISIPLMALTAFAIIIAALLLGYAGKKKRSRK